MKQPLLFFGFLLIFIVGFVMLLTNYRNPSTQLSGLMANEPIDDCYDETMSRWFVEFNHNQEAGVTMQHADKQASTLALAEYQHCINQ